MRLRAHSFDFGESLLTVRIPRDVMENHRWGAGEIDADLSGVMFPLHAQSEVEPRSANSACAAIMVWPFHSAPAAYRALSGHGGDEDWIAYVPNDFPGGQPSWMLSGSSFGCCDVSKHEADGGRVYIGAHA